MAKSLLEQQEDAGRAPPLCRLTYLLNVAITFNWSPNLSTVEVISLTAGEVPKLRGDSLRAKA